jgi:hypothetical protein
MKVNSLKHLSRRQNLGHPVDSTWSIEYHFFCHLWLSSLSNQLPIETVDVTGNGFV